MSKMEETGLFAGSGNESGKISRVKKAGKLRDFSNDTVRKGIDTAAYGYKEYQKAKNSIGSKKSLGLAEEIWKIWKMLLRGVRFQCLTLKNHTIKM